MFRTLLMATILATGFLFATTPQAEARWGRAYRPRVVNYRNVYRPPVSVYRTRAYYGAPRGPRVYNYRGYAPGYYGGYGYPGVYRGSINVPGVSIGIGF